MKNTSKRFSVYRLIPSVFFLVACSAAMEAQSVPPSPSAGNADGETVVLSPFEVSGTANTGYGVQSTASSGRLVQAYVDVPQTVSVLTSQFISDFGLLTSAQALEYVPNVYTGAAINNGSYYIRGIETQASYFDGILGTGGSTTQSAFGTFSLPTDFFDRIEIVKGPSSAAFGLGDPSGIINYVSKQPSGVDRTVITGGVGEYNNYRFSADTQGVNGKVSYRLVLVQEAGDAYQEETHSATTGAQLALKYRIDSQTSLSWILSDSKIVSPAALPPQQFMTTIAAQAGDNGIGVLPFPGYGLPAGTIQLPALIPKSDLATPPGWNTDTIDSFRSTLIAEHIFNEHVSIRDAIGIFNTGEEQHIMVATDVVNSHPSPSQYEMQVIALNWPNYSHEVRDALDLLVNEDFLGGNWRTLVGGEIYQAAMREQFQVNVPNFMVDIYHPFANGSVIPAINAGTWNNVVWDSDSDKGFGAYIQEDATFLHGLISLSAGWRIDYLNYSNANYLTGVQTAPGWENTGGAPRYAITIKPLKGLSFYALYTQHKDPTQVANKWVIEGETPPSSVIPDPAAKLFYQPEGTLVEFGSKASFLDGGLTASVSVFHTVNGGQLVSGGTSATYINPDGTPTDYSSQTQGIVYDHGIEGEITGQPTRRLVFTGSVAESTLRANNDPNYVNHHYRQGPPVTVGLHGRYDFGDLNGNGFFLTTGTIWYSPYTYLYGAVSRTTEVNLATGKTGDAYDFYYPNWQYTVDAGLGYGWDRGRQKISLNSTNLTNQLVSLGEGASGNFSQIPLRQTWITYTLTF